MSAISVSLSSARTCAEMLLVAEVDQGVEIGERLDDHVAAAAAIAAVGTAILDEFLAPEAHAPGPAVTGLRVDLALVEEFHGGARVAAGRGPERERGNGAGRSPVLVSRGWGGTSIPPPPEPG
jgi:hypothetical protein